MIPTEAQWRDLLFCGSVFS